jgi:large subunit ribosomal protein L22
MNARAISKFNRMSPSKIRRVLSLIKNKSVAESLQILKFTPGAAAPKVLKTVKSAAANLKQQNAVLKDEEIFVTKVVANAGPIIKRFRPRAQGRATLERKRTSHIEIVVTNDYIGG